MKPLTPNQQRCADRLRTLGGVAYVDDDGFAMRGRWRERAALPGCARLIGEIGCADASLLARVGARRPSTAFVGIDWKYDDALRAAERTEAAGLTNVAIVRGRAADLPRTFGDGELNELWVFHPEPCAPPRERPNRLLAEPFLLDAATALRVGGALAIKTDHAGYFRAMLALLRLGEPAWPTRTRLRDVDPLDAKTSMSEAAGAIFDVAFVSPDFWSDAAAQAHVGERAFAGERTDYERRFVEKRRPIFYVELRRRATIPPMEPMKPMRPMEAMKPMEPMKFPDPWWPASYGRSNAAGGQNDVRYAYFGDKRRLLVDAGDGAVKAYDTGDHQITGIQQAQGGRSQLVFSSNDGPIALDSLTAVALEE